MTIDARESPELIARHEKHVAAWNALDFDAMAELYHPDCLVFDTLPPPVHKGWEEFRAQAEPAMRAFSHFSLQTFDRASRAFQRVDDRIGWVTSRYEIEGLIGDQNYEQSGRWTEIYEKRKGGWQLIHFHSSDDPAGIG